MRRRLAATPIALFALVAFFLRLVGASAEPSPPPPFVVVVHPSNPSGTLSRKFVGEAFLKKTTRWADGDVIRPVDLLPDSPVRAKFSQDVLKRSVAEVKSYWQQIIFSGRDVPPPELPDDDAVLKFVAKNGGAIGYVSGAARLADVKPVVVE
jgi:ABC-type phosphate transport system substrate-binding protein